MKRIAFFIVFLFATTIVPCMAQEQGKHSYEVGAGINAYGILGAVGGPGRTLGPGVHFEYRNSISDRFDLGGRIYYKYGTGESAPTGGPTWGIVFNQVGAKAVADFIMRPAKVVRPYIGAGAGAGMMIEKASTGTSDTSIYGTIGPRIGLQIWRFRLALEFDFAYNMQYGFLSTETATGLSLSYVF